MQWVRSLTVFIVLAFPAFGSAEEFNAGFVQGLWLDTDDVFVGDTVRIYAAVRNNTGADLTGTVEFYVDDKRIERNNVSALNGRIVESWADWEPTYGEHTLAATLSRVELQRIGSSGEEIEVTSQLAEYTIFIDHDTDDDGIGDKNDTDDDGDGIDDETEEENGTDPLDPDDPAPEDDDDESREKTDNEEDVENEREDDADTTSNDNSDDPQGLEQFLTENRADYALSSITQIINDLKRDLDTYRDHRSVGNDTHAGTGDAAESQSDSAASPSTPRSTTSSTTSSGTTSTDITTNESGFGEVRRTTEQAPVGFLTNATELLRALIESLYTFVLFMLSLYLSHPIIVQLTLLILILFLVYKVARRLGQRQQ